jgi:uncharacterized membrane protein
MKKLTAALALGALVLSSRNSFAWFEICNTKSNGADMYVTYAYYEPNTTTLYTDACGSFSRVFSPQFYTAWKNTGWWHLNQNQCATVYGPTLANTWGYIYAQISDGSSLTGANVPFTVANTAFGIDQYASGPFGSCSGECVGQTGSGDCGSPGPTYWRVNTLPINQDSYQNYKVNIY